MTARRKQMFALIFALSLALVGPLAAVLTGLWMLVLLAGLLVALPVGLVGWVRIARKEHSSDQARRQVNFEDSKGVVACVMSWAKSEQVESVVGAIAFLFSSGALIVLARDGIHYLRHDPLLGLMLLLWCLAIPLLVGFLIRDLLSRDRKLLIVRRVLLQIAFDECRCPLPEDDESTCRARGAIVDEYRIIISDPTEPENVGKPIGKGYCHACQARGVLEEHFSGGN
jgi:hypothetical protein